MKAHVVTKTLPAQIEPLTDSQVGELADLLRLLGEPTRLRVLLACLAEPAGVGEIAARVNLPRSLASHHLRLLRASRFLSATRRGKQMIYASVDDRVRCILVDLVGHVAKPSPEDEDEPEC